MSARTQALAGHGPAEEAPAALTILQAAETTGWSARMLRYIEQIGLVAPARSESGYRLYGPAELQRLRTLRELQHSFEVGLAEVSFALRMRREAGMRAAVEGWLSARPERPGHVSDAGWLSYEQAKHERLLASIGPTDATPTTPTPQRQTMEAP